MRGKLGDLPTMKVEPAMLEEYARRADRTATDARAVPPAPVEIPVTFDEEPPTAVGKQTAMRPVARTIGGVSLDAVPMVAVSKDDLGWFELEPEVHAVLARVDGFASVSEIVAGLSLDPPLVMALLIDLASQHVITLG